MSWHIENSDSEKRKPLKLEKLGDFTQTPSQGGKSSAGCASTIRNAQNMAIFKHGSTILFGHNLAKAISCYLYFYNEMIL